MKNLLLFLLCLTAARAQVTSSNFVTQAIVIPADRYTVFFSVYWTCADFPVTSTPGRVELVDSANQVVGWAEGHVTQFGATGQTNAGSVEVLGSNLFIMAPDLSVADGTFTGIWHITGVPAGAYTLRFWDFETQPGWVFSSTVWTHTVFDGGSAPVSNQPPTVTLLAPGNQTVTAGTTLTLSARATDPDGNLTGHNLDIQRPAGDWNFQGGFATGEPFQGGPVGSGADSTRTASFTFNEVGTYQVRSGADDGSGWTHSATVAVTVVAPPPVQYALVTGVGAGGAVTPGGTYNAGTVVAVTATPDGIHDFAGWSGDAGGAVNPLGVLLDGNKTVQANFTLKSFALTSSASAGGTVTPGGFYPYGTIVTLSAMPDATHRFVGWAGDASGAKASVVIFIDGAKAVQAVFADKVAQTITFPAPADQPVGGPPVALAATTSSGLPVGYAVLSGPAVLDGNLLTINGPGAVTVQASQGGDSYYLPAANVSRTLNAVAAAVLKYRPAGRTFLQSRASRGGVPFVLEKP